MLQLVIFAAAWRSFLSLFSPLFDIISPFAAIISRHYLVSAFISIVSFLSDISLSHYMPFSRRFSFSPFIRCRRYAGCAIFITPLLIFHAPLLFIE